METFKITFYRDDDQEVNEAGEKLSGSVELMALNEAVAATIFQSAEPFATILKVEMI